MTEIGMSVDELDTPCLLVDLDLMKGNIERWQSAIGKTQAALRPHVKTHKVPDIARMQLAAGAHGITVAKLSEAEVFAANGIDDIFVAYPIVGPAKWKHAAALAKVCMLAVGTDSEVGARGLSAAAVEAGSTIRVRLEIDLGLNRAGAAPERAAELCRLILSLPGLELDGIYTYRSISFAGANKRPEAELGHEEGELIVSVAEELRSAGIPIRTVSAGSTPTGRAAAEVAGVTEVRPGTYIFGDYMTAERGTIGYDEIALTILCTVISRPMPGRATVDGGAKTFSGDAFPPKLNLKGYARAVDREAYVDGLTEEHGVVQLGPGVDPQVGERIAFYPIHVCTTVNLSDELIGIRNGRVAEVWPIAARGKRT